jgi:hypothetical protein
MLIVSMADAAFKDRVEFSMKQAKKFGYDMRVFDMGGLGFGEPYVAPQSYSSHRLSHRAKMCMIKPRIMLKALDTSDETVVFLDADAFLVKPIDEIETDDYDVGVTYKGGEKRTYINAGVIFFKQTDAARDFLWDWIRMIDDADTKLKKVNPCQMGDQIFLNDLVFSHVSKGPLLNKVKLVGGTRVKFFDYRDYNHFNLSRNLVVESSETQLKPIPSNTRIVHLRHSHPDTYLEVRDKWQM